MLPPGSIGVEKRAWLDSILYLVAQVGMLAPRATRDKFRAMLVPGRSTDPFARAI